MLSISGGNNLSEQHNRELANQKQSTSSAAHVQVLKRICWYVVLASSSSEQITLLETTAGDKRLQELPVYKELLRTFTTKEVQCLKRWSFLPPGSSLWRCAVLRVFHRLNLVSYTAT